jgi:superfamily II DNA or RNA helicase
VHAVVSVPTGAGKSALAELAIAQTVRDGWVLYLAPTNPLLAQARQDLTRALSPPENVQVRDFLGGAEYTQLEGEALGVIADSNVLVMTAEKCSLALRQPRARSNASRSV